MGPFPSICDIVRRYEIPAYEHSLPLVLAVYEAEQEQQSPDLPPAVGGQRFHPRSAVKALAAALEIQNAGVLAAQNAGVLAAQDAEGLAAQDGEGLAAQDAEGLEAPDAGVLGAQGAGVLESGSPFCALALSHRTRHT